MQHFCVGMNMGTITSVKFISSISAPICGSNEGRIPDTSTYIKALVFMQRYYYYKVKSFAIATISRPYSWASTENLIFFEHPDFNSLIKLKQ